MEAPKSLEEAKALVRAEKAKLTGSLSAIAGSRWLMAVLAALAIAFGVNAIYSPAQLPALAGLSAVELGLPPNLDFGLVGEQAIQARDAALREGADERAASLLDENRGLAPLLNWIGFGVAFAALIGNMWIMTIRRRFTRG
ncbi:MAG: hypothetical protein JNM59_12895 [Hyphomonadaceae bacterium]|nr:hypothetical protein [Hyphomonadaceae bacterium]